MTQESISTINDDNRDSAKNIAGSDLKQVSVRIDQATYSLLKMSAEKNCRSINMQILYYLKLGLGTESLYTVSYAGALAPPQERKE